MGRGMLTAPSLRSGQAYRLTARPHAYARGLMFMFVRNRLVGSYLPLIRASRSV